ncbi:MAG: efflux RND transporter periplasmic adaptor subunit [Bacteroidales bacterium]
MKKIIIILGIIITIVACKNNGDKKAQLDKLIKEREALTEQINKLQKEYDAANPDTNAKTKLVELSEIKNQEFNHFIEVQGKVDGEDNIYVAPKMSGVITSVYVKEGDAVKKGQLLAQIDDAIIRQSIDELQNQQVFATNIYNKQKNLWEKKIGSEVQYLTAKNNKESLDKKMNTLKEQMEMSKITAPITGTIEEIGVKVGQIAIPAPNTPAFRMVNFSKVKVTAEVAEAYSQKVRKGDNVIINFPDFNKEVNTTISFSSKFINPTNRTFTIESRLNSGDMEFRANMIALVKINDYKKKDAIVIPVGIIQKDAAGEYVFVSVDKGNKKIAEKRIIKSGQNYNGNVEIIEGLKAGDQIIVTAYQNLEDGETIKL